MLEIAKSFVIPLVAAFGGAWFAFRLEWKARKRRERHERFNICRTAQFALTCQYNTVLTAKVGLLDKCKDAPNRWASLPALPFVDSIPEIDMKELAFMLEWEKKPDSLGDIFSAQYRFLSWLEHVKGRNNAYAEYHKGGCQSLDHQRILEAVTDAIYAQTDGVIEALTEQIRVLADYMKEAFPGCSPLELSGRPSVDDEDSDA